MSHPVKLGSQGESETKVSHKVVECPVKMADSWSPVQVAPVTTVPRLCFHPPTYPSDHFCCPFSVPCGLKAKDESGYHDLSRITWRLISASQRLCIHGETECHGGAVWICNDICQEASPALQSEVTGEIRDRIRMATEKRTCAGACWQSAEMIDIVLSVSLLTDEWIHAEHIVITCGTYMLLPLLLFSTFPCLAPALEQHCPSVAAIPPALYPLEVGWRSGEFTALSCICTTVDARTFLSSAWLEEALCKKDTAEVLFCQHA